jgi:FAD/FMN-containing dehydrogenase
MSCTHHPRCHARLRAPSSGTISRVVTADGEVITASTTEHQDLFWALRGGGGNFGVVTSFEYQLHPVGPMLAGMAIYPRSQARDILRAQRDFSQAAPDPVASFIGLMTSPDGDPVVAVPMGYNGPLAEGERLLAPLRRLGTALFDDVGPKAYIEERFRSPESHAQLDDILGDAPTADTREHHGRHRDR